MDRIFWTSFIKDLYIVDTKEGRYATDSYWAAPVPEGLKELFDWWRIPLEPGVYQIQDGRLEERSDTALPNLDYLLEEAKKVTRQVVPLTVVTQPMLLRIEGEEFALFHEADAEVTDALIKNHLTPARIDFLKAAFGEFWWTKSIRQNVPGPVSVKCLISNDPLALVMPRHT